MEIIRFIHLFVKSLSFSEILSDISKIMKMPDRIINLKIKPNINSCVFV
jgi:hypothetical protein